MSDELRDEIARAAAEARRTWRGGPDGAFDQHLADAIMPVVAAHDARLRKTIDYERSLHYGDDDSECQECGEYWPCGTYVRLGEAK